MNVKLTLDARAAARLVHAIHLARDGQEAPDNLWPRALRPHHHAHLPDWLLLDLRLPRADVLELPRQVESTSVPHRPPKPALTSSTEEAERVTSCDHGAERRPVKPITHDSSLEVVRRIGDHWLTRNVGLSKEHRV